MKISTLVTALALALGASGVQAQTVAFGASLSNVNFGVIDLTPDDGQAAGFNYELRDSSYSVWASAPGEREYIRDVTSGAAPVDYTVSATAAQVHVQATGVPGAIGVSGAGPEYGAGRASAEAAQGWIFTLAPYSVLTFSAVAHQHVSELSPGGRGISELRVSMFNTDDGRKQSFYQLLTTRVDPNASYDRDIWLAYANPTDTARSVTVTFGANVSTIPEPSTYAMLGAGLLAIGAVARRRANLA